MVCLARNDDADASVITTTENGLTRIRMAVCPGQVPDATVNALHKAISETVAQSPARIVLDMSGCARADSRVVALTCEAVRECAGKGVALEILPSRALKAWLFVYRIPLLKQVVPGGRWRRPATVLVPPTI